jgi:hypothetical protein
MQPSEQKPRRTLVGAWRHAVVGTCIASLVSTAIPRPVHADGGGAAKGAIVGAAIGVVVAGFAALVGRAAPLRVEGTRSLTFAEQRIGSTAEREITLANRKNRAVTIEALTTSEPAFSVVEPVNLPLTLAPKGMLKVTVRFQPQSAGKLDGKLDVRGKDRDSSIRLKLSLKGKGVA